MPDEPKPLPLPDADLFVLACVPSSKQAQKELGIALYSPTPGSVEVDCTECGQKVWLGPMQVKAKEKALERKAVVMTACPKCLVEKYGLNPDTPIQSAGTGRGGKFEMTDGRVME
jgi:hypothetical protein